MDSSVPADEVQSLMQKVADEYVVKHPSYGEIGALTSYDYTETGRD